MAKEKDIKAKIRASFSQELNLINESHLNGFMKLWLYQFYAVPHLSWPFIVFDLDRTFALDLQKEHSSQLKKWAYIGCSVDTGLLFRSKENFGLGLTSICDHYEIMQLVKCELLRNSTDSDIRELCRSRPARNAKLTRVWKATKLLSKVDAEVDLNLKFPVQI